MSDLSVSSDHRMYSGGAVGSAGLSSAPLAYDAVVIGAHHGGSDAAMLLAQRGYRVLVLDRASIDPRELPDLHRRLVPPPQPAEWRPAA